MTGFIYIAPLFVIVVITDSLISLIEGRKIYAKRDTFSNFVIGITGTLTDLLMKGISLYVLFFFYDGSSTLMNEGSYWLVLFLMQDFLIYLLHLAEHKIRFLWASHFIHHSSGRFNFSTSLRVSVFQPFYRYLFYIPIVWIGFHPVDLFIVHGLSKVYVFFLHTERVGKLGWIEWVLNTPSHHRVHHGRNQKFLDKNMGNVLIVWDRLFGTFAEENEKVIFGTTSGPSSDNPLIHLLFEWNSIAKDVKKSRGWDNKIRSFFRMK